jgi:hypothetical protein
MKLSTIWSSQYMSTTERFRRSFEWGAMTTARHLPKRIRYWTTLIEIGKAVRDSPDIPATPLGQILKNLQGGPK